MRSACLIPAALGLLTLLNRSPLTVTEHSPESSLLVNGVIVNAPSASGVVYLRNLTINGAGNGLNGIRYLQAKELHVENCAIYGFGNTAAGNGNGIIAALGLPGISSSEIRPSLTAQWRVSPPVAALLLFRRWTEFQEALPTGLIVGITLAYGSQLRDCSEWQHRRVDWWLELVRQY